MTPQAHEGGPRIIEVRGLRAASGAILLTPAKVAHYYLSVSAMTRPMQVGEGSAPYGDES